AAKRQPGLVLHRVIPHLGARLRTAAASVSQCGYNTALDILHAHVPALVVPFATEEEDEQIRRARRLERLCPLRGLDPQHLHASTLAEEIRTLLPFQPHTVTLDMAGALNTARLVHSLTHTPRALIPMASTPIAQGVS